MIDIEPKEFDEIQQIDTIDILIAAVGYESRASYFSNLLKSRNIGKRYCIQLVEKCNEKEKEEFANMKFVFISVSELEEILSCDFANVVIDYTVMMKSIYAEIVRFISLHDKFVNRKFYFSYTQSVYEKIDKHDTQIKSINRILTTDSKLMNVPRNGYKLIISLGHERLSAIGLVENLEISYEDVIILINKESEDAPYYKECISSNKEFLALLQPEQIIEIDFFNFAQTITVLDAIYYKLNLIDTHIILAPMSIKMFSLLSMVHSLNYPNVFFYNVTSVVTSSNGQKRPAEDILPKIYLVTRNVDPIGIF